MRHLVRTVLLATPGVHADEASGPARKIYDRPNGVTSSRSAAVADRKKAVRAHPGIVTCRWLDKSGGETTNQIRFFNLEDIAETVSPVSYPASRWRTPFTSGNTVIFTAFVAVSALRFAVPRGAVSRSGT